VEIQRRPADVYAPTYDPHTSGTFGLGDYPPLYYPSYDSGRDLESTWDCASRLGRLGFGYGGFGWAGHELVRRRLFVNGGFFNHYGYGIGGGFGRDMARLGGRGIGGG